ncbi:MAG TPA: 2TM domain-containing protein [Polyangiaceae bacterium]|nr:2TM domain-containing protein [Polyangiaceae bacterium]
MSERRYTDAEVRAILDRALRSDLSRGVSHDQLLSVAAEVGISREALEAAALDVEEGRETEQARDRILKRRRRAFLNHLWTFLGVQAFLIAVNLLTIPYYLWFLYPLMGWGLGLFFHARYGLSKEVSEKAIQRELKRSERRRRREERDARRATGQPAGNVSLGSALEQGMGLLASKVLHEIQKNVGGPDERVRVQGPGQSAGGVASGREPYENREWTEGGAERAPDRQRR